jgi:hypothetical protein
MPSVPLISGAALQRCANLGGIMLDGIDQETHAALMLLPLEPVELSEFLALHPYQQVFADDIKGRLAGYTLVSKDEKVFEERGLQLAHQDMVDPRIRRFCEGFRLLVPKRGDEATLAVSNWPFAMSADPEAGLPRVYGRVQMARYGWDRPVVLREHLSASLGFGRERRAAYHTGAGTALRVLKVIDIVPPGQHPTSINKAA